MAGWALHLWNEWSIQILVLFSYTLQVVLLFFSRMRRRNISCAPRLLLWLAYRLADSTALYTLGHISTSKSPELRLPAFWAQFLLLHLGGQDSMTAYALEDNQLWLRHLLTLVLQALGAAYLLYRHIAGRGTLLTSAILIHVVGILKYGERVWTLKSSSHDGITNFLDKIEMSRRRPPLSNNQVAVGEQEHKVDAEEVLQEAHDLLYICMGQFVDYKVWPSEWQQEAIKSRHKNGGLMELVGMQLSLMHDVFYTKAVVIRTWYGCCNRVVSLVTIVTALWLFRFKTRNASYRTSDVDVAVTYTLLVGAILLEMTSILRAIGSSWTCAFFRTRRWHRLHSAVVFFRRLFKSAEHGRRWQGNAGQYNLLDLCTMKHDLSRRLARNAGLDNWLNKLRSTKNIAFSGENDSTQLVLGEMERMVEACQGKEDTMWSYRGQNALSKLDGFKEDADWCIDIEFDESILAWHFATYVYLTANMQDSADAASLQLAVAIKVLSNYMMFLLAEHAYLLPSPVRSIQYVMASKWLLNPDKSGDRLHQIVDRIQNKEYANFEHVLLCGATLATRLLELGCSPDVLCAIFGVWVEKLCYAASHCSRDSHTRQLNSGAEFITVVWILATALFNNFYSDLAWYQSQTNGFIKARYSAKQEFTLINKLSIVKGTDMATIP